MSLSGVRSANRPVSWKLTQNPIIMRLFFTSTLVLLLTSTILYGDRRCSDLIISEIIFADDGSSNYSVEIFNPTDNAINLSAYKIELLPAQGSGTTIALSGSIPSEGVTVISNQAATDAITTVSDILTSSLNYSSKAVLQLVKGTSTIVDRIGNQGTSTDLSSIDLDLLLNDSTYLDGLNINLGSLKGLGIKRKRKVQSGTPSFVNADVFENWALFLSLDYGGLGEHVNACMMPVLSWKDWSFLEPEDKREEGNSDPVFGIIESTAVLADTVYVFFELDPYEFTIPAVYVDAILDEDFTTPLGDPTITYLLLPGSDEFEFEILTALTNPDSEDEGIGFRFDITLNSPATVEYDEDLFDVWITEMNTSTYSVELSRFLKVYPSLLRESTTLEVSGDGLKIQEVSILDASGRLLKKTEYSNERKVVVDFSSVREAGFFTLAVRTNKGIASKRVIKL